MRLTWEMGRGSLRLMRVVWSAFDQIRPPKVRCGCGSAAKLRQSRPVRFAFQIAVLSMAPWLDDVIVLSVIVTGVFVPFGRNRSANTTEKGRTFDLRCNQRHHLIIVIHQITLLHQTGCEHVRNGWYRAILELAQSEKVQSSRLPFEAGTIPL